MPAHPTPTNVPLARSNVILQKHNSANYAKKKLGHFQIDVPVRQFCSLAYWQNPEDKKTGPLDRNSDLSAETGKMVLKVGERCWLGAGYTSLPKYRQLTAYIWVSKAQWVASICFLPFSCHVHENSFAASSRGGC